MYEIHTDVPMTRRKNLHHITDNTEEVVWSGARLFDAFQYMLDNEHYNFYLRHEGNVIKVMVGTVSD